MNSKTATRPLDSFAAIRSQNAEEVRDELVRVYGARQFSLGRNREGLNVRANHWQSRDIALSYCNYGTAVQVEFPPADFFRLQVCLIGTAEVNVDGSSRRLTRTESCVIPPGVHLINNFPEGYEQLVLRIRTGALTSKLAAVIGDRAGSKIEFEPILPVDSLAQLRRMLLFFASELDALGTQLPSVAVAELEQALITYFLCKNPSNFSANLEGRAQGTATWQVRRAEEYIEAYWAQPITIEELARVASSSARSLFHHFKRSRGRSPMEFLKHVRLQHARELLSQPNVNTSVTETAFACGFSNLGHFAKDYFIRFGERPSATLKRTKGNLPLSELEKV